MRQVLLTTAIVLVLAAATAQGWWCTGHMTISRIAEKQLSDSTKKKVNDAIYTLSQIGPFPKAPDMVQAACWADDIKDNQFAMAGWHFLNQVYDPTGVSYQNPIQKVNVETAIPFMEDGVRKNPNQWELSYAVANLIHFYGDIHQPLHVTEMFSSRYPTGDLGGNLFHVYLNGTKMRLHSVWDSLCGQYQNEWDRPLSSARVAEIDALADYFLGQYSPSQSEKDIWNTTVMAQEGYNDAITYSYASLVPEQSLSQNYLDNCWTVVTKRIVLAGYRLANDLEYLLGGHHDHLSERYKAKMMLERVKEIQTAAKNAKL